MIHPHLIRLPRLLLLSLVCVLVGIALVHADDPEQLPYRWDTVRIGGGSPVGNVLVHPVAKDVVYLRTTAGNLYRWDAAQERWLPGWTQGIAESGVANGSFDLVEYPNMPLSQALEMLNRLPIPPKVPDPGNYCLPSLGFDERSVSRNEAGGYFLWPENRNCSLEEARRIVLQIYGYPG